MTLVIDASIALAWCFEDEVSVATEAIADSVRDSGAVVPVLWHWETANSLLQAERRKRIGTAGVATSLRLLATLPIETDEADRDRIWRETLALARAERLTVHDAAYLELALRLGATLATRYTDLAAAARRLGVPALP